MAAELVLIGVPTSAGAHHAGQDLTPSVLRAHGLLNRLKAAGLTVSDAGDVAGERWAPDAADSAARNVGAVVRVATAVRDAVAGHAATARIPVVIGGDCTITLGVVAGLQQVHQDVRLAYFDGDADLSSPERTRSGVLDATGVAHLLGIADTPLAHIGRQVPMLADHQLTLLGYDTSDPDSYDAAALAARPGLRHASDAQLRDDPAGVARGAVDAISSPGARVAVHFDIDSVDSRDLALANFPHYGTGVPLATAGHVLRTLLTVPGLAAVTLTEVNPTHDPTGQLIERYIDTVVSAFSAALVA